MKGKDQEVRKSNPKRGRFFRVQVIGLRAKACNLHCRFLDSSLGTG